MLLDVVVGSRLGLAVGIGRGVRLMRCLALRWVVAGPMCATLAGCSSRTEPVLGEQATSLRVLAGSQQVWSAGAGPAVVLVNGIGNDATSAQWLEVERELTRDVRVCRYDRLETGESSVPVGGRGVAMGSSSWRTPSAAT